MQKNPKTGEVIYLDSNGQWQPSKIAENPKTGEKLAFDGASWVAFGNKKEQSLGEKISGITDQAVRGALPFSDEISAAGGAVGGSIANILKGKPADISKEYDESLNAQRHRMKSFEENNPTTATVSQLLGGVATIPLGGALKAPSIAKSAMQSAGIGALFGLGEGENLDDRLKQGASSGVISGALGGAIPAVGKIVSPIYDSVLSSINSRLKPADWASKKLASALERDNLSIKDFQKKFSDLGGEATLADSGGSNVLALAEVLANAPGKGAEKARVFQNRVEGQDSRLYDSINQNISPVQDFYGKISELTDIGKKKAAPLYAQAYQNPEMALSPALADMAQTPSVKRAFDRAKTIAGEEGYAIPDNNYFSKSQKSKEVLGIDPITYELTKSLEPESQKSLSWKDWDYIKRGLDDVLEENRNPITGKLNLDELGRAQAITRSKLVGELDRLNPKYAEARQAFAEPARLKESLTLGREFDKLDPEQIKQQFDRMLPEEQEMFKSGVSRRLKDKIDKTKDGGDATRRILASDLDRKQLQSILGEGQYKAFEKDVSRENLFAKNRNTILSNSATARRLAGKEDLASDNTGLVDVLLDLKSAPTKIIRNATNKMRLPPERAANELADILMTQQKSGDFDKIFENLGKNQEIKNLTQKQRALIARLLTQESSRQIGIE